MCGNKAKRVDDRIVSISQPHVQGQGREGHGVWAKLSLSLFFRAGMEGDGLIGTRRGGYGTEKPICLPSQELYSRLAFLEFYFFQETLGRACETQHISP
ncbi:hypothetical protein SAMN02745216_01032 [Desulfatibacillum alkenivorans DSM 16219]|jgi:hypothetical protein|uniref:Uncharacterized protein n=1 Tax=Desulfatibacillum alkenivorans DSM 16219 TaxID=1121393 RepID=A0A1M6GJV6_9BACT|nr:hypothetical protein SAMN02745216_01032 [Desulfatibacillum alkenivorans DSM 16219]